MSAIPFLVIYLLLAPHEAEAYLDPGSGSLAFQVAIAFFVGLGFTVKMNWRRFLALFMRKDKRPMPKEETLKEEEPRTDV